MSSCWLKSLFWFAVAGSEKRTVEVKNYLPANMVPNTAVERMLTINGKIITWCRSAASRQQWDFLNSSFVELLLSCFTVIGSVVSEQ